MRAISRTQVLLASATDRYLTTVEACALCAWRTQVLYLASATFPALLPTLPAQAADYAYQPALAGKDYGKSEMSYADFTRTESGLSYKDAKAGNTARKPERGDRCVVEWTGYSARLNIQSTLTARALTTAMPSMFSYLAAIGYFGRPFETRQLKELDSQDTSYLRFELGDGSVIPALEEGIAGMNEGGIRQLVVPPAIGYPDSDPTHERVGPRPSTFSGQRALNFVLQNQQLIDKTVSVKGPTQISRNRIKSHPEHHIFACGGPTATLQCQAGAHRQAGRIRLEGWQQRESMSHSPPLWPFVCLASYGRYLIVTNKACDG